MAQEEKSKKKNRLSYMILSVIIAIIAWVLVTYITDPDITKTFAGVRVEITGEDVLAKNGYVVANSNDLPKLSVKMRGKRSDLIKALDKARVIIDVSELDEEGEFEVETSVKLPNSRIVVERIGEPSIPVTISKLRTKEIPVRIIQTGELSGRLVKSVPKTETVPIKGASSELDMIDAVEVLVDITNITESGETELSYVLAMKDGADREDVSTINITENIITVINTVYEEKELPIEVKAKTQNTHALSDKDTKTDPTTVRVGIEDGVSIDRLIVTIDEKAPEGEYKIEKADGVYIPENRRTVTVKPVWDKIN